MELFGTTRSRSRRSHALIAPESFVTSDLPGWERSQGIILIAPSNGCPVLAVPRDDGARRHRGPATAGRRASALCARRASRSDAAGHERAIARSRRICLLSAGYSRRAASDRALAPQRIREALRDSARFPGPRIALRQRAGCRGHGVHGRLRTRSSRSSCRATRGSTWPSTSSRFSPGRRCRWSRFM